MPVRIQTAAALFLLAIAGMLLASSCAARAPAPIMNEDTLVVSPEPPMVLRVDKSFLYMGEILLDPESTGEPLSLALNEQVFFEVDNRKRVQRAITIGTMLPPTGAAFNEFIWNPTEQLVYGGEIFGGLPFRGRTAAVAAGESFYLRERADLEGFTFPDLLLVRELGLLVGDTGVFLISYVEALDGELEDWQTVNNLDEERTGHVLDMAHRLRSSVLPVMGEEELSPEPPTESWPDQGLPSEDGLLPMEQPPGHELPALGVPNTECQPRHPADCPDSGLI